MKTIPRSYIDNFTMSLNKVSATNRDALRAQLEAVDYTDMTRAINQIVPIMEAACNISSLEAGRIAQEFYRGMAKLQTGGDYRGVVDTGHTSEATERAVRGIVQEGVNGDLEGMIESLLERLDYEVKKSAGTTVISSGDHDFKRAKPRYARVPAGAETCTWCIMLAGRGAVYTDKGTAGLEHYHANCDCRIVPVWGSLPKKTPRGGIIRRGGIDIEGYNPDYYYDLYANPEKLRALKKGVNVDKVVDNYIHGQYGQYADYTQFRYGGSSEWETRSDAALGMNEVDAQTKKEADFLYRQVITSTNEPRTLIRTEKDSSGSRMSEGGPGRSERYGRVPTVGTVLDFGVKSSAADPDFAIKIAADEVEGLQPTYGTTASNGDEVLAFRINDATRYFDISAASDYETQSEALIAGRYVVDAVSVETVYVGAGAPTMQPMSPRQYAAANGLELEYFTSKKGKPMVRFGQRTYPESSIDTPTDALSMLVESQGQPVTIKYVDLKEI